MKKDVKDHYLNYLRETHLELRDEIKRRVKQRSDYYIQYLLALAALFGIQIYDVPVLRFAILLIPMITIYYTYLTLRSGRIHSRIVDFLRDNIEVRLHKEFDLPKEDLNNLFWENYSNQKRSRINDKTQDGNITFFEVLSLVMPFVSGFLFYLTWNLDPNKPEYILNITIASTTIYLLIALIIIIRNSIRINSSKNNK